MLNSPLYQVEGPWRGQLAIVARPRGGDWLEDDIRTYKEYGLDLIVSLLTPTENVRLELTEEAQLCQKHNLRFLGFPIEDHSAPESRADTFKLASKILDAVTRGENVALHCWGGVGRSGMITACVLVSSGVEPSGALQRVSTARGASVPDTPEQRQWVIEFAREIVGGAGER